MADPKLHEYIAKERQRGANESQIREALLANGWKAEDIEEALRGQTVAAGSSATVLPDVRTLITQSLHIYGQRFWMYLGLAIVPGLAILLLTGILGVGAGATFIAGANGIALAAFVVIGIIAILAAIYVALWGQVTLISAIANRQENVGVADYLKRTRSLIPSFFATSFVVGFIVGGGFFLLIIPGIYLSVLLSFAVYSTVTEGQFNMNAVMRSRALVIGRWWKVFGRLLVAWVIAWILQFIIGIFLGVVQQSLQWGALISQFVRSLLSFVIAPFVIIYTMLLFESLRQMVPLTVPDEKKKRVLVVTAIAGYVIFIAFIILAITTFRLTY